MCRVLSIICFFSTVSFFFLIWCNATLGKRQWWKKHETQMHCVCAFLEGSWWHSDWCATHVSWCASLWVIGTVPCHMDGDFFRTSQFKEGSANKNSDLNFSWGRSINGYGTWLTATNMGCSLMNPDVRLEARWVQRCPIILATAPSSTCCPISNHFAEVAPPTTLKKMNWVPG